MHELGHSFGKLADEYWFSGSGESTNKTKNNNPETNKWKNWIGLNSVDIFPYTESPTWFRPHQNCEMRYLDREFYSVCKQQLIERVHTLQNPIDCFTPSNGASINLTGPITFNVNAILPIPNSLVNSWSLNGNSQAETTSALTLSAANSNMDTNTILFSVTDNNSLLKVDNHATLHVATVSWTINKTLAAIEVNSAQRNFQVYPNPAKSQIFIKDESKTLKNISVEIYDAAGTNLKNPRVPNLSANEISVNVDGLLPQSYIIKVYENKNLILTQKIIKE